MEKVKGGYIGYTSGDSSKILHRTRGRRGGNFGVVTSFVYQLHPIGPTILGGMVLYPQNQAKDVLRFYRDFARNISDDLIVFAALPNTPDRMPVIALLVGWFGPLAEGEQYLKPLRDFGTPLADLIAEVPYTQHQTLFDAATPHGIHRYWKSGNLPAIPDGFIDVLVEQASRQPSPFSFILFFHMKGVAARVDSAKTAVSGEKTTFRNPVGADAAPLLGWRASLSDEDWIASAGIDEETWIAGMAQLGADVRPYLKIATDEVK